MNQSNLTGTSTKLRGQPRLFPQRWRLRRSCACLVRVLSRLVVQLSDEAAETVARDELLAVQLEPRRGRGVVGLEPLLDGAALVRMAIYLFAFATGRG